MIRIIRTEEITEGWRSARFDMLAEPQELYLENLVKTGTMFQLEREGRQIGYAVTDGRTYLLELGLAKQVLADLPAVMAAMATGCGVRHVLAQSFDPILMSAGFLSGHIPRKRALLFRVICDEAFEKPEGVACMLASASDVPELLTISDDFFHDAAEIEAYLSHDGLWAYRGPAGELLGAGVVKQTIPGRNNVDVGMVVSPWHRGRGIGSLIVRHLKLHCLRQGWRPVCGCAVTNIGSQRALEKAGFAAIHHLMDFAPNASS